jgi:hypothetical protein
MEIFGIPIETAQDLLYISLAGGFLFLVLILVLVLGRVYKILGNVQEITDSIAEITDIARHYIYQPIKLVRNIISKISGFLKR